MFNPPHPETYRDQLRAFLREDWGTQDWSSGSVRDRPMRGAIKAKSLLVLAGLPMAVEVLRIVDERIKTTPWQEDGSIVQPGSVVLAIEGPSRSILMAERVMLNLVQRLSGTATLTGMFVEMVEGTGAKILDTRKTTPGLKLMEKYAVRCGGGFNHRLTLGDGVLLKENHLAAADSLRSAVESARLISPSLTRIEVEVERLDQLAQCLKLPEVDGVLLDNMDLESIRAAVEMRNASGRRFFLEASGNITLERARAIAETGVDFLSIGALTHSAPAADLSLRLEA